MQPSPALTEDDPSYKWKVLAAVVSGLFIVLLDATIVNVALKALQDKFAVGTNEVQWVVSLYTLALGVATPLSGFLGDRFGVKRVYLGALFLFVLGSTLCGLAPNLTLLIAARAIQGIGGGLALPLGTAMLFGAFPPQMRGAAFGIFGIVLVFSPAIGPLAGGWLVDHNLLNWIFFVNIPVGAIGLGIGLNFLKDTPGSPKARGDYPGILFSALGFGAILYATSIAGEQGSSWTDPRVLTALTIGLLGLAALTYFELRSPEPLLDLKLYGIPSFAIANVASLVGTIALFGAEFLLPLYLQILRGKSAFDTGLFLLPLAIASGITSVLAGRIADRLGPRVPIVVGFVIIAFNTFQLSQITMTTDLNFITVLLILRGIALGLIIQNTQVAALANVPLNRLNRATPLVQATRQTMQAIGVAILATILSNAITVSRPASATGSGDLSKLPPPAREQVLNAIHTFQTQYITGLDHAYKATFIIAVIAAILSLFLPGWPGKVTTAARREDVRPKTSETQEQVSVG